MNIFDKINEKIYYDRNYAKLMYDNGYLPCENYFEYEIKKSEYINNYFQL